MERYRNFIRLEEIKEYMQDGKKEAALELAEEMDFSRLKSVADMSTVAEVYVENGILVKARDCYLRIYSKAKTRRTAMQLINLAIRLKDAEQAETYYSEFCRMAPGDFYSHIYRYRINKMEGKPCTELISNLEELKKVEYIDTWAYELAKLYHKAGEREKCIEECNDIEIWFGSGEIVDRAVALRSYYLGELDFNTVGEASDVSGKGGEPDAGETADNRTAWPDDEETYEVSPAGEDVGAEYSDAQADEEIWPESLGEQAARENEPESLGEQAARENEPESLGGQADRENEPEFLGEQADRENEPEALGEQAARENEPEILGEQADEEIADESVEAQGDYEAEEQPMIDEDEQLIYRLLQEEENYLSAAVLEELKQEEKDKEYESCISEAGEDKTDAVEDNVAKDDFAEREAARPVKTAEEQPEGVAEAAGPAKTDDDKPESVEEAAEPVKTNEEEPESVAEAAEPVKIDEEEPESVAEAAEPAKTDEEEQPEDLSDAAEESAASAKICSAAELLAELSLRGTGRREIRINEDGYLAHFLEEKNTSLEEYFGFFACHEGLRGQIIKNLEILLNPQIKNLCLAVSGGKQSGETSLIKGVAKLLYQAGCLANCRLAVTDAMKINRMRLSEKTDVFTGGCLVINKAGQLDSTACKELIALEGKLAGRTAIIITDDRTELNRLFRDNREMNSVFPNRVHIPSFDRDDLLMLAYYILAEDGYSLTHEADTALIQSIQNLLRMYPEGLLAETEKKIRSVIDKTEERNAKSYIRQTMEGKVPERNSLISAEDIVG